MSRLFKKSALILIFTWAGLSLFTSCSQEKQTVDKSEGVSIHKQDTSKETDEDMREYWTDERMREAVPLDMGRVMPEDGQATVPQESRPGRCPARICPRECARQ